MKINFLISLLFVGFLNCADVDDSAGIVTNTTAAPKKNSAIDRKLIIQKSKAILSRYEDFLNSDANTIHPVILEIFNKFLNNPDNSTKILIPKFLVLKVENQSTIINHLFEAIKSNNFNGSEDIDKIIHSRVGYFCTKHNLMQMKENLLQYAYIFYLKFLNNIYAIKVKMVDEEGYTFGQ